MSEHARIEAGGILRRAVVFWAVFSAVVVGSVFAQTSPPAGPIQARAYEVRYKALADAAELVGSVLSQAGSVTMQPRLKTLIVQDRPEVLDRVATLLRSFDLPPRNVEVTLSLFLGTDRRDDEAGRQVSSAGVTREVRGVTETLGDVTKWNAYEPLGSRSVTGAEGAKVTANLSDDYRVVFEVESVQGPQGAVKFRSFSLQKVTKGADGERTEDLITTAIVIPAGRLLVVGAAKGPESKKALFLTVQARPR
jgi:hypothetical protein